MFGWSSDIQQEPLSMWTSDNFPQQSANCTENEPRKKCIAKAQEHTLFPETKRPSSKNLSNAYHKSVVVTKLIHGLLVLTQFVFVCQHTQTSPCQIKNLKNDTNQQIKKLLQLGSPLVVKNDDEQMRSGHQAPLMTVTEQMIILQFILQMEKKKQKIKGFVCTVVMLVMPAGKITMEQRLQEFACYVGWSTSIIYNAQVNTVVSVSIPS